MANDSSNRYRLKVETERERETQKESGGNKLLYTPLALKHGRNEENDFSAAASVSVAAL